MVPSTDPSAPVPASADEDPVVPAQGEPRLWSAVVLLVLVLATVALNLVHVDRYRPLGPVDELQHFDAALRAPEGDFIGPGDVFSQEAMRTESCRGVDAPGMVLPPCPTDDSTVLDPTQYQEGGYNTAYIHPPTFYVVQGTVGRVLHWAFGDRYDDLTSIRIAGLIWAVGGVILLWYLLREMGTTIAQRAALVGLVVGSLAVLEATATINVDATAIPLGAAVLWLTLRWERGRSARWLLLLVVALCAFTKVTNLLGVGIAMLYLATRAYESYRDWRAEGGPTLREAGWKRLPEPVRRTVVTLAWFVPAMVLPSLAWAVGQRMLQSVPPETLPMLQRFKVTEFPWAELSANWRQGISPLGAPNLIPELAKPGVSFWVALLDLTVIGLAVTGTVLARRRSRERLIGANAMAVAVLVGPLIVIFNAVVQGIYVVVPPRYAMSVVPALLVAALPVLRLRRWVAVPVALVGIGSYLTIMINLA